MTRLRLILLLLAACGPDKTDTTGDTATGDTATSTATSPDTTSDDPPTTDDSGDVPTSPLSSDTTPTTTGDDTGVVTTTGIGTETGVVTTTGAETTGAETGGTTTADTTTGAADDEYTAFFFAGGLDHILIHKADHQNDRCTTLHLARPNMGDPNLAITVPEMWGPVNAGITMGLDGCLEGTPGDLGVAATAGAGAITWELDPMQLCPGLIAFSLDLEFPQDMPWVPAKEHLETMDLVVQNCP